MLYTLTHRHTPAYSDRYPDLGDIFVIPDHNDSLLELDTIVITYALMIPEDAYQVNFTALAETLYTTSDNVSVTFSSSNVWLVILEPILTVVLNVSER